MKKHKGVLCALITAMLAVSLPLVGCGKKDTKSTESPAAKTVNGVDISKEVEVTMYLVGDAQNDAEKVYAEVNKKLKQDINTTVNVKYLSWADWDKKYPLVLASGEELDCIYTADWAHYASQSTKGAFKLLDQEIIKKYMPEYYIKVPANFWNEIKINGKIYMIPYINQQVEGQTIPMIRGDLREKYNLPKVNSIDTFVNYLITIAQNEKGMIGYDGSASNLADLMNSVFYKQPNELFLYHLVPFFTTKLSDMNGTVNYALDDPAYLDMLKTSKKLADAGVWTKGILASKNDNVAAFDAGKTPFYVSNGEGMVTGSGKYASSHPEWKAEVSDTSPDKLHESSSGTRSGMSISANSKNFERVMLMLNLFGTRKDYYDLTTYGIEGVHYTPVGDNKLKSTEEGLKNYAPKANCPWGWERTDFMRVPDNTPDEVMNMEKNWIANGLASKNPIVSFNFVDTNVKNEIAACNNIYQTKGYILLAGMSSDIEGDLAKMKDDLKKAGIDKIRDEIQKQVTAYLESLK